MCEYRITTQPMCKRPSAFFVTVETVPQPLGPDGIYGMETSPAGRSNLVCAAHLARTVRTLDALPIRAYGATVNVRPYVRKAEVSR